MSGRIVIRGATIPLSEVSAPSKVAITESNITAPYLFKLEEIMRFGLTVSFSEVVPHPSENVKFGVTLFASEDLQGNLSESVNITNP